jgi:hypothetical protein
VIHVNTNSNYLALSVEALSANDLFQKDEGKTFFLSHLHFKSMINQLIKTIFAHYQANIPYMIQKTSERMVNLNDAK